MNDHDAPLSDGLCPHLSAPALSTLSHVRGAAQARAYVNIALIKYWGKADASENLPAVGSLSMTLSDWGSETQVCWVQRDESVTSSRGHSLFFNGISRDDLKMSRLLDRALNLAVERGHPWAHQVSAVVHTQNTVPTASGLASSASGMAALGLATWSALGYDSDPLDAALIDLTRIGSGSAVRSLLGGIARLERDGRTLHSLCAPQDWDLALVVCVVDPGPKAVSSREGMERTRLTSPYYQAWLETHAEDLDAAEEAVRRRDLATLGALMEHSTFKMHASMWAARPPLRYLKGVTLEVLDQVEQLRARGIDAWATMDAGPHVKVLCQGAEAPKIAQELAQNPRLSEVVIRAPGPAAKSEVLR